MNESASLPACLELSMQLWSGWGPMRSRMSNGRAEVEPAPSANLRGDDRQVPYGPIRSAVPAGASVPQWGRRAGV